MGYYRALCKVHHRDLCKVRHRDLCKARHRDLCRVHHQDLCRVHHQDLCIYLLAICSYSITYEVLFYLSKKHYLALLLKYQQDLQPSSSVVEISLYL